MQRGNEHGGDGKGRKLASGFQTRLEPLPPPPTYTVYTQPFPFFKLEAMCEYSDTIPPPGELIDPLFLEIFLELEYLKRRLVVVTTSSELAITLESIKDAIARCKDYQLKESLIRELVAEIVDLKVTVRNRSGEDCDEYRMLVLQEKRVAHW
ncbi:uncharacterized protein BT62DRAFT_633540 [Guyanagaster necrorhizus]|uniref:Uncharacterized protein n=1 Tax=Guyanagaster necrorhizus TaxID=856835 RepID=A0A9P7VGR0_9AGAR|nr:uncharacterized protein BT62DRAFT_633540 [Guyanagaster necrorhizus MCA 3950]KAG7440258.1 hypothetical protein BT62DRAFT_633540 [Guyanagaster necrorhizus MCA 3950]